VRSECSATFMPKVPNSEAMTLQCIDEGRNAATNDREHVFDSKVAQTACKGRGDRCIAFDGMSPTHDFFRHVNSPRYVNSFAGVYLAYSDSGGSNGDRTKVSSCRRH
jgi:hypothetical protein